MTAPIKIKRIYKAFKITTIIYSVFFVYSFFIWIFMLPENFRYTFQRYIILYETCGTFAEKMEKLLEQDKSLLYIGKVDSSAWDTVIHLNKKYDTFFFNKDTMAVYIFLKDMKTSAVLRIRNEIPLRVDFESLGEHKRFSKKPELRSINDIRHAIALCQSFEKNVLSRICEFRRDWPMIISVWLGDFSYTGAKVRFYILFFLIFATSLLNWLHKKTVIYVL